MTLSPIADKTPDMTANPLVSVVVPTYKRPDFLKRTMESILSQTYQNLELIIISNGRNPENEAAARSFNDPRVRYADQDNSGGPSGPRNHGIRLAMGDFIAFCDDDDLWLPKKLEKQVQTLLANPSCGFCYTRMVCFNEQGDEWAVEVPQRPASFKTMLYKNDVPVSSIVMRADLVRKHGGFHEGPEVGDAEDYEFSLRYSYVAQFVFVNEVLLRYWAGRGRTTASDDVRRLRHEIRYLRDIAGCFRIFHRQFKGSPTIFIMPFMQAAKGSAKLWLYQTLKRNNLISKNG